MSTRRFRIRRFASARIERERQVRDMLSHNTIIGSTTIAVKSARSGVIPEHWPKPDFWHPVGTPGTLFRMPILNWWASRRQRKRDAYSKNHAYATPEEAEKLKRRRFKTRLTGGMPEGTGISPTGRPIDFTADEKPPRY